MALCFSTSAGGTGWAVTSHAYQAMSQRGVVWEQVLEALRFPQLQLPGGKGRRSITGKNGVRVVVAQDRSIITVVGARR